MQVGDPFQEKLLLEASLEAIATGAVVGMQDMGAAGITCSTSEMSAKAGVGMRLELDKVPTRQSNMKAWEILLSESQERMLIVGEPGRESELKAVFDKWDLPCELIGTTTDTGRIEYFYNGKLEADVPAHDLVLGGGAPVYVREKRKPKYLKKIEKYESSKLKHNTSIRDSARKLWRSPNLISKKWITEQYDSTVRIGTMTTNRFSDAAIVRVPGTQKALALTTDCNSSYVYADPYRGAMIAVAEAARNIVCAGGEPVAITNCLNFGNPYNPEVYFQFSEAIRGMGDACRKFGTPVTGGNVSFYNQYAHRGKVVPVFPTPTIGMLGILEDADDVMTLDFKGFGDFIYVIGTSREDLGSSEYLREVLKVKYSPCPHFDLEEEFFIQNVVKKLLKAKIVRSCHDVSEGGLFANLVESVLTDRLFGFEINMPDNLAKSGLTPEAWLFGESQSRIVVTVSQANVLKLEEFLRKENAPFSQIGKVTLLTIKINNLDFGTTSSWRRTYDQRLGQIMDLN